MKYNYYAKAFNHKPNGSHDMNEILNNTWKGEYNKLSDIYGAFNHGYTISFRDIDEVQVVIIDIDNFKNNIIDETIISNFNSEYKNKYYLTHGCSYYDKTSKKTEEEKNSTFKIFAWLENSIQNITENLKNETNRIIDELKANEPFLFGNLENIDEHQFSNKQITFGKPQSDIFVNSSFNGLQLNENDEFIGSTKVNEKKENTPSIESIMTIFQKENQNGHQIGITKKDIFGWVKKWYRNKHGKNIPDATTYTIIAKTYTPYFKAEYDIDGSLLRMAQVIIQDGKRHWVADKIVDIIAFNAFSRSVFYNDIPSISDCWNKFVWLTMSTFEKKNDDYWFKTEVEKYKGKIIKAYRNYLENTDWSGFDKTNSYTITELLEYIAINSLSLDQDDIQWTYRPQNEELLKFTKDNDYMTMLVEYANNNRNYYQIWDAIGPDCGGDVELMCKLMNALRRRIDFKIPKERTDKGGTHKQHKEHSNKGKCLEGYTLEDNKVYIPEGIKITSAIRKYCSKNKITIVRVKDQ